MALQDLTPQLRTRLNRMERAVGFFVVVATVLLLVGFGYFLRSTAKRKGWFTPKFKYQTSLNNAAGLKEGDVVRLMGFPAGKILKIEPNDPNDYFGVTVTFDVMQPHYGYIWDDSKVKVNSDLLGNRFLEISKGQFGVPTIKESTNRVALAMLQWKQIRAERKTVEQQIRNADPDLEHGSPATFLWQVKERLLEIAATNTAQFYTNLSEVYWFDPEEAPAVNERVEQLVNKVEAALPNILDLTNKLNAVLGNSAALASNLNVVALGVQPVVSNVNFLTTELRGPGALGQWALGTNGQQSLDNTLANANLLLAHSDTNLTVLMESFGETLEHLAAITSNLNAQVQANTNMLGSISQAVVDTDDLVQGLKRHWLLRSAFKKKPTGK